MSTGPAHSPNSKPFLLDMGYIEDVIEVALMIWPE